MAAQQIIFSLRTSSNVKTVQLVGSWDNYARQLPLSKDASKSGSWKGNFRFQGATIKPGQRYWYYYVVNGNQASHDPSSPAIKEPTTGRMLNVLDVPAPAKSAAKRLSTVVPVVRGISPSRIAHPRPTKAYASQQIRTADYAVSPKLDDLVCSFENTALYDRKATYSPTGSISSISSGLTFSSVSSPGGYSSDSDSDICSDSEDELPMQKSAPIAVVRTVRGRARA